MNRRILALAAWGALLFSTPTQAQEAEAAGGPLRFVGGSSDSLKFVVDELPEARPISPVEVWEWTMFRNDRTAGSFSYNVAAYRVRIDCQTGTRQVIAAELFKDGEHLLRLVDQTHVIETPEPGTLFHNTFRIACEPGFHLLRGEVVPDHRAARTAADRYFEANP